MRLERGARAIVRARRQPSRCVDSFPTPWPADQPCRFDARARQRSSAEPTVAAGVITACGRAAERWAYGCSSCRRGRWLVAVAVAGLVELS
jgi:hypothetical protein